MQPASEFSNKKNVPCAKSDWIFIHHAQIPHVARMDALQLETFQCFAETCRQSGHSMQKEAEKAAMLNPNWQLTCRWCATIGATLSPIVLPCTSCTVAGCKLLDSRTHWIPVGRSSKHVRSKNRTPENSSAYLRSSLKRPASSDSATRSTRSGGGVI